MIGQTISHYRVISQLGEGGMGVVYLAEDITLGRRVAMKFLSTTTREYRARFLREARAVSALTHPNIATVFDYGETSDSQPYIVMELIKGEPLNEKLRNGPLPLSEAVRIVSAIAEALGEAHHQGVVHRDVKPSNVVITERGQVKVLDFGLVKHIFETATLAVDPNQKTLPSTRTRSDVIVGTPLYLSPEQATGKAIDGRSDLFALGAVLYECITGHSAFSGGSVIEIGAQVIHVNPSPPSKLNDRVPPELDRITMKAIQKKLDERYQTAEEFAADLQRVLPTLDDNGYHTGKSMESQQARTASASALTTMIEPFRRPGPNLGIFILAIVAVALLAGWMAWKWWKPSAYVAPPEAQAMYDKGTDALRYGAFLQATKALEEAVRIDSKFAMAHARLGEAWYELDYVDKAKDELLKAQPPGGTAWSLPQLDALHLEAIHATVTQDFPGAIKANSEIVRLLPNDPQAYIDLGRAYEKNDQVPEAIESFVKATELAPQHPTAFLRLAILYGKQINLDTAFAKFDRADTLYQAAGNIEGQAEVAYQRGFLLNQNDKYVEAQPQLEHALALARTTNNVYAEVKSLLKLGEVTDAQGSAAEGRAYMQQGMDLAERNGIDNYVKRGLIDMGNSFMVKRDYVEAEKYFKQSLELSQRQKDPRNMARALLSLAVVSQRFDKPDDSLSYVEQALPFYQRGGYRRETIQAFAILARIKKKRGENEAALKAFEEELKIAQFLGEQSLIALANVDIGLVMMTQARYPEALTHFEEGYRIAQASNNKGQAALYLINRANALWNLGRYGEAKPLLADLATKVTQPEGRGFASWYYVSTTRLALSERDFDVAQKQAQNGIKVATLTPITETALLGWAQGLSGTSQTGRANCQKAVDMLTPTFDVEDAAEARLALAEIQLQTGDRAGALKNSQDSQQLFARLGRQDLEWLALLIAARASSSDASKAQEFASRAEALLSGLQQKWSNENYQSYLSRPDVQFHRGQLNALLARKP